MKRALQLSTVVVGYLVTAWLGRWVGTVSGGTTLVWPPAGIALVALSLLGVRAWPAIFVAATTFSVWNGSPVLAGIGIGAGNTLEAIVALTILERLRFDRSFARVRDATAFITAALVSPVVAASAGVSSRWFAGIVTQADFRTQWGEWWLRGALGTLLFAPVVWVWMRKPVSTLRSRIEWAALLIVSGGTASIVFLSKHVGDWQLPYLMYPGLIWAALRFRQRGAATVLVLVDAIAIAGTLLQRGPFFVGTFETSLVLLQSFMAVTAITLLLLATASAERDGAITLRDEFLSIASHELRTPLTSLKLHLEMLRRAARSGGDNAKVIEKVSDLEVQIDRLGSLVTELLDVSRAVGGRLKLDLQSLDLCSAVSSAAQKLTTNAQSAGSELKLNLQPCPGQWDATRVEQIVAALISNAIKFGPGQPIEVGVAAQPEQAVITVRDHGSGIKPEDQGRIFERFERAVSTRHFGGLGLGLWLTRQVVDASGGSISVSSEVGHGAQFTVVLPRRPVPA